MERLDSNFALVDVKRGANKLAKRVKKGERIEVSIRGFIIDTWSAFDGISQEFELEVITAEIVN